MANTVYPEAPATITGDNISASRFLQSPRLVARRLQSLGDRRYIGSLLLPGRQPTSGGAIAYETVGEGIFADAAPEIVTPGAEYSMTTVATGPAGVSRVVKYGKDTLVTDESVKRASGSMGPVDRAMLKLTNSAALVIDQSVLSVIASAITATFNAATKWNAAGATILLDVLRAKSSIRALNLGYDANVLAVDEDVWPYLAADTTIAAAMAREDRSNPVYTGRFDVLAGLEVIPVPAANLPGGVGTSAWLIDRGNLGYIATEDLGGGYLPAGGNGLVEAKSMRVDENDAWRLRVRANFVPVVTDPGAGFRIGNVK